MTLLPVDSSSRSSGTQVHHLYVFLRYRQRLEEVIKCHGGSLWLCGEHSMPSLTTAEKASNDNAYSLAPPESGMVARGKRPSRYKPYEMFHAFT